MSKYAHYIAASIPGSLARYLCVIDRRCIAVIKSEHCTLWVTSFQCELFEVTLLSMVSNYLVAVARQNRIMMERVTRNTLLAFIAFIIAVCNHTETNSDVLFRKARRPIAIGIICHRFFFGWIHSVILWAAMYTYSVCNCCWRQSAE